MKRALLIMLFLVCYVQTASASQAVILAPQKSTNLPASYCEKNIGVIDRVDMEKVRSAWLSWYNEAREKNGRGALEYDSNLDRTARIWSETSKQNGTIVHKRPGQTAYYDYKKMLSWFKNWGLTFPSVNGSTFVENIGWNYYSCPSSTKDCTDNLIASIRKTYNFFMGEKDKKYRAHYDSIMNGNYKKIGLGITVDPGKKKYYLTVHYATDVVAVNDTAKNVAACEVPGNGKF